MMKFMKYFSHIHDYLFGRNTLSNSSCPSSSVKWCFNDIDGYKFCIQNPTFIPICILALLIGLYCSKKISKLPGKFPTRWIYQLIFLLYGIMMTSAGILHCFLGDPRKLSHTLRHNHADSNLFIQLLFAVIDAGLTTNIAITFLFCGLCDIKFLNPKSTCTHFLLVSSYVTIFVLWSLGIINQWSWTFLVLYIGTISVCCFIYLLTQLCIKSNCRALPLLLVGGIYGAIGLYATTYGADRVCKSEGPFWSQYFGPSFLWFLFSDISMTFMFLYVVRANEEKKVIINKYPIDIEENPEKF